MLLLDCNSEVDSLKHLLETGDSVNAPPNPFEQSPVHLAAGGGCACLLLWQLQTGADLNQQDVFGEAPLHKAAKVGSLECLSLLVASDAQIEILFQLLKTGMPTLCWTLLATEDTTVSKNGISVSFTSSVLQPTFV
nr:PREDICTED: ankyrin repeat domain-containing protein 37 isoform X3 [Rhinolophus sinicus]